MNKLILALTLSVILLTFSFTLVSAQSPEEQKLKDENAKLKQKIKDLQEQIDELKKTFYEKSNTKEKPSNDKSKTNSSLCKGNTLCITGTVKRIIDGDTIYIDTYKVRLSLVNTPERGKAGYSEATAFTKKLCIKGTTAIVDQDDKQPFDRFNRVVGKVYCSDKNVNAELLENNHATIMKKYCKTSEFASESWALKRGC